MNLPYRYRKLTSVAALAPFFVAAALTPAFAEYHPELGRWLQRDPNETALVLRAGLDWAGTAPDVMLQLDAAAQYQNGLSLYEGLRGNPVRFVDPAGLSILERHWRWTISEWNSYQRTYMGRAWQSRFDGVLPVRVYDAI